MIVIVVALTAVPWAVAPLSPVTPAWPSVVRVQPVGCLNAALDRYGSAGDGWSGGDSTWTTALPDDRELFAFSDTFLSTASGRERPGSAPFVHNSFVVRDAQGGMRTVVGSGPTGPASLLAPSEPGAWYWLGAVTFLGGALQVPLGKWRTAGPGPFDWEFGGSSVARFDPDDLSRPTSVTPLRDTRNIQWGQWVAPAQDHTYLYGVEGAGADKKLHVARVAGSDLRAPLAFFDGSTWRPADPNGRGTSTPIAHGVSAELSVHRVRDGVYLLVTTEGGPGLSDRIVGRYGSSPTGPFGTPRLFYRTPETGAAGSYRDPDVYTYNAHAHPEFSTSGEVVISYNVNSVDTSVGGDVYRDTTIYRPRFITVTLDGQGDDTPDRPVCR
ncbi:hypothetical protein GOARA_040_00020 [Gordonia araii NBRC 100433]|uniref:DUF4185 domain-containing protein n=1 Tax=Gordonia araii NBRC 100433 TaxID=1073574 RepID=G7H0V2_9ACTN|nr:hypothetical protein GOARA_040_00020 [Gordonia araii NBRC 100433]